MTKVRGKKCGVLAEVRGKKCSIKADVRSKKCVLKLMFVAKSVFLLDVGLLGALSEIDPTQMLLSDNAIKEYKGALTENYVLCQMKCIDDLYPYYYSREDSKLEIDFIVQHKGEVMPIEVKAEENLRSKSLSSFVSAHSGLRAIRYSMSKYIDQGWVRNIPLYGIPLPF